MKNKIRFTESELVRLINKILVEQSTQSGNIVLCKSLGIPKQGFCSKKTKKGVRFGPCGLLPPDRNGNSPKYPGMCEFTTRKPVDSCKNLGNNCKEKVCYVGTKEPVKGT